MYIFVEYLDCLAHCNQSNAARCEACRLSHLLRFLLVRSVIDSQASGFLGSVPNRDHVGPNPYGRMTHSSGCVMGGLSLIRQIFGVMIGDHGEVAESIRYTEGHAMHEDQLKEQWKRFKGELKQQ